jgi:NADPH:quinone reductase-like Zn-dependent oxidoreductase
VTEIPSIPFITYTPFNTTAGKMALQNHGIIKTTTGKAILTSIPFPKLRDDYILVKTVAVALNPTDWQAVDIAFKPETANTLLGCDAAGIVVEVGKNVTKNFKKGDRVACMAHGGPFFLDRYLPGSEFLLTVVDGDEGNEAQAEDGTFAEYIVVKGDIAIHIPQSMSFEDASSLSCGVATTGLALYRYLELPFLTLPIEEKKETGPPLLIYGGSTATGTIAIQFAKL